MLATPFRLPLVLKGYHTLAAKKNHRWVQHVNILQKAHDDDDD